MTITATQVTALTREYWSMEPMDPPPPTRAGEINTRDPAQVYALAKEWGVSTYRIDLAVERVGPKVSDVFAHLLKNSARQRPLVNLP